MRGFRSWSRSDKLAFIGLLIAGLGTIATILAVPGVFRTTNSAPEDARNAVAPPKKEPASGNPSQLSPGAMPTTSSTQDASSGSCALSSGFENEFKTIIQQAASGFKPFRGIQVSQDTWSPKAQLTGFSECKITYSERDQNYTLACVLPRLFEACSQTVIDSVENLLNGEDDWKKLSSDGSLLSMMRMATEYSHDRFGKVSIEPITDTKGCIDAPAGRNALNALTCTVKFVGLSFSSVSGAKKR